MPEYTNILITQPVLPELDALYSELQDVWRKKRVTNMGEKHEELENKLQLELKVKNLSLFNNGTIALMVGLKALGLPVGSEVITTPFTFAATPHCISWNGMTPVFCDIEPDTMCIDPEKIEKLITSKTSAILAVHVYGIPCEVDKIQKIADKYNLKVIYDAAHAFTTEINGKSIGTFGDITMYSFHATKLFNTIEGGCLTYNNSDLTKKIKNLRNFGIIDEENIVDIGLNGKMNEIQALIGLLNLQEYKNEKVKRQRVKEFYNENIRKIKGIRIPIRSNNITCESFQYYPIIVEDNFRVSRDALYDNFRFNSIFVRKYFYPLCSDYECYRNLSSSNPKNLSIANSIKNKVLCLPFYGGLSQNDLSRIINILK